MKKLMTLVFMVFLILSFVFGQTPNCFNYQAIVRDNTGKIINGKNVSFKIDIIQDTNVGGTIKYSESFSNEMTSSFGLVNLNIGKGTATYGKFNTLNWGMHKYYIEVSMDPNNGTNYTLMGISQLLSVPYALYAA